MIMNTRCVVCVTVKRSASTERSRYIQMQLSETSHHAWGSQLPSSRDTEPTSPPPPKAPPCRGRRPARQVDNDGSGGDGKEWSVVGSSGGATGSMHLAASMRLVRMRRHQRHAQPDDSPLGSRAAGRH
mmetsp:Transcript_17536/g.39313  ORF Transcript_17536/g.39313 Transcript_17536/m.39313 type:complete len:128 (-) Transcript_17536:1844-2227(-)